MTSFNLTDDDYKCPDCQEWVKSDGHDCVDWPKREHIFRSLTDGSETIVTAGSINAAWRRLAQTVDDTINWLYFGRVSENRRTPREVASDYTARTGEDLRELSDS